MSASPQALSGKSGGFFKNDNFRAVQFERRTGKWLREDVGKLVAGGNGNQLQISGLGLSVNEVVLDFDVLGASGNSGLYTIRIALWLSQ